jgi:hypothetical protein
MPVLGTLPNDKAKLVGLYISENSNYQTNLSRLDTAKRIAQDVNESPERRAEFKKKYDDLKEKVEDGRKNRDKLEKAVSALEGGKEIAKLQDKYKDLAEAKSLLLEPNGPEAKAIDDKIDKLAQSFQNSYVKVVGKRVSPTIAKSYLSGGKPATFGAPSNQQDVPQTNLLESKIPDAPNTPSASTNKPASTLSQSSNTPSKVPTTTINPATGETVKVSKIKPEVSGTKYPKPEVGPGINEGDKITGSLDQLLEKTEFWYDLPDYIFKIDTKLGELLVKAADQEWTNEKFLAAAQLTPWWQKNSGPIRERIVSREKYNDLRAAGEDVSKTEYGIYLGKQMRNVKSKAQTIAGITLTDEQAQSVAQKIYDGFLDDDPVAITELITPFIGKVSSIVGTGTGQKGFSGKALQDYQMLQEIAKKNGFTITDILPNVSAITAGGDLETAVLRKLANGELDINRINQDARMMASQGQPQYVRDLLNQGYDLVDVYAPYINQMARELDLDPNTIDLNDSSLRMAITDKGDMNLYDFKKALRQDNRWQYTEQAKSDVSTAALGVLRDFGFQG